jgi:hypothetical protein
MKPHISPWPFDQPRNCAAFTLRQVMQKQEPILRVNHDAEDHGWQFFGSTGANIKDAMIVSLEEVVQLDLSVLEIADLPPGWHATRESTMHSWIRSESLPDEENGA